MQEKVIFWYFGSPDFLNAQNFYEVLSDNNLTNNEWVFYPQTNIRIDFWHNEKKTIYLIAYAISLKELTAEYTGKAEAYAILLMGNCDCVVKLVETIRQKADYFTDEEPNPQFEREAFMQFLGIPDPRITIDVSLITLRPSKKRIVWSFKSVHFGNTENFKDLLEENNLDRYYYNTEKNFHVWYNEGRKLYLGTLYNPLEETFEEKLIRKKGEAGNIGISGLCYDVIKIRDYIVTKTFLKDEEPLKLEYFPAL